MPVAVLRASAVQMVSEVLENGRERIGAVLTEITTWLTDGEYSSLAELEGCMNIDHCPDPAYYLQIEPVKDMMRHWRHRR